jgi:hypothetical protein
MILVPGHASHIVFSLKNIRLVQLHDLPGPTDWLWMEFLPIDTHVSKELKPIYNGVRRYRCSIVSAATDFIANPVIAQRPLFTPVERKPIIISKQDKLYITDQGRKTT